ncbi:MAG TPA: ATP-binding protein [Vicinamibacteria bacterium]
MKLASLSFRRSLRARLVGSFLTVSLVIVGFVAIVAFLEARSALRDAVVERLQAAAVDREAELNQWIDRRRASLVFLAGLAELRKDASIVVANPPGSIAFGAARGRIEALLNSASASLGDLEELFLLTSPGGEVIASTDLRRLGDYHVNDLFYSRGKSETFVQNVYTSPVTGRPALTISTPVVDHRGRTEAVLAANLDLAHVDRLVADRTGLGTSGEAYLVGPSNDFVSSGRFGRLEYRRGVFSVGIDRALAGEQGVGEYLNYASVPVIGAYRWNPERELALVVELTQEEAFAPARRLVTTILGIGLVSALVLTGGVFLVALQIARPVLAITKAASDVSRGNFETVAPVMTQDEVGVLATAFNDMTDRLRQLYFDLNQQVDATTRAMVDLEKNRKLLQAIIDNSTTLIAVTDRDEKFLLLNRSLERFLGVPQTAALGKTPRDFLPASVSSAYLEAARTALAEGRVSEKELEVPMRDERRSFLLVCFPLRAGQAQPYGVGAVATDLTEIRRAQEAKERLEAQVQHAQKLESLGLMAGGIAHDFNNILTGVIGNADLALQSVPAASSAHAHLERVMAATKRAAELTGQMLAYAGKASLQQETFDLNTLLDEMTDLVKASVPKKIAFRAELLAQPAWIRGNRGQIGQLVMNLITNAAEAVGDGPGSVLVATSNREEGGERRVALTVKDTGRGMDGKTIARIFDPFFSTKGPGRGLGLAAVQGIVRSASGKLSVDSTAGGGSTFEVVFPSARESAHATPAASPAEDLFFGSGTLLVADDEPLVRNVARVLLESAGFDVLEAANGVEAVAVYRDKAAQIRAVLLDLTMPGLGGVEALKMIREFDPEARVILSSGYDERDTLAHLDRDQGVEFLQKPYRARTLLAKLRTVLDRYDRESVTRH